jgi:hypothetical protein
MSEHTEQPVLIKEGADHTPGAFNLMKPGESPAVQTLPSTREEPTMMGLIAEMARDGKIDIVEKLIGMKNSEADRESKLAFARDYAPMKAELPKIIKNKKNEHTKSGYADLANINEVVDPILGKYGFATSTKVIAQTATSVTVKAELIHKGGHREEMELTMPLDTSGGNAKSAPQSIVSSISYCKRAAKCALLDIAAGDEDTDGNPPPPAPQFISIEQAADIDTRLRAIGADALPRFLKWAKIAAVTELTVRNYPAAIKAIVASEADAAKTKVPA